MWEGPPPTFSSNNNRQSDHNRRLDKHETDKLFNPLRAVASGMLQPPAFGTQSMVLPVSRPEPNGPQSGFRDRILAYEAVNPPVRRMQSSRRPMGQQKDELDYLLEPIRRLNRVGPQSYTELAMQNIQAQRTAANQAQQQYVAAYGTPPPPLTPQEQRIFQQQQAYRQRVDGFATNPLVANMTKNPDLNLFERASVGVQAMEVDGVRLMQGLPVGTDLYRYKMEQTKELGTVRAELLKMLDEIKLRGVKRRFDMLLNRDQKTMDDQMWADEQMKAIILKQLRKSVGKEKALEMYNGANIKSRNNY